LLSKVVLIQRKAVQYLNLSCFLISSREATLISQPANALMKAATHPARFSFTKCVQNKSSSNATHLQAHLGSTSTAKYFQEL